LIKYNKKIKFAIKNKTIYTFIIFLDKIEGIKNSTEIYVKIIATGSTINSNSDITNNSRDNAVEIYKPTNLTFSQFIDKYNPSAFYLIPPLQR
jgi:hypothetical protein